MKNSEEPDDRPLVFVEKVGGALKLFHCDQRAVQLGLLPGLALADARARIPDLTVVEADHEGDQRVMLQLAEFCDRISPLVALDPPYGVMIDITGCSHLFGGERKLCARLKSWASRSGLALLSAIAGTPDTARAIVRFGSADISLPGRDEAKARLLPISALESCDEIHLALSRAGLKTLADMADRPSKALSARFGKDLLTKLGRILGFEDRRISPLRQPPDCSADVHFPEPVLDATILAKALGQLAEQISALLDERGQGGRAFEASFFRADGVVRRVIVETSRANRVPSSILHLFRERLETIADPIDPGFGFDIVRLSAFVIEPLAQAQPELDQCTSYDEVLSNLIDRLAVRLGSDRILRFVQQDTHNPQRAAISVPASGHDEHVARSWLIQFFNEPPSRPIQFFDPPQLIEAYLFDIPDGPPKHFRWRRVLHVVENAEGPERIAPEWWRADRISETHDYYRVEDTEGHRFWIFRAGVINRETVNAQWFLRGVFA